MPALITVQVELAKLLEKSQAIVEGNREAQRRKEADGREDPERLAAKQTDKKKALEDPVGRNIRPAAMGRSSLGVDQFPGFFTIYGGTTKIVVKVRSGIKATNTTAVFEEVTDSPDYVNEIDVATITRTPLPVPDVVGPIACPEYAAMFAEVTSGEPWIPPSISSEGVDLGRDGWHAVLTPTQQFYFYIRNFEGVIIDLSGVPQPSVFQLTYEFRNLTPITSTGGDQVVTGGRFSFASLLAPNGTPLPRGKFRFYYGIQETVSVTPVVFGGFLVSASYGDIGGGEWGVIREEQIPCTGGIPGLGPVTTGPVAYGWEIAMEARYPSSQSVTPVSTSALDIAELATGDLSSYPGAVQYGDLIFSTTPDLDDPVYDEPAPPTEG